MTSVCGWQTKALFPSGKSKQRLKDNVNCKSGGENKIFSIILKRFFSQYNNPKVKNANNTY